MTNETTTTYGETQVVHIFAIDGYLFHTKLTKINAKLAKQGLDACKVLNVDFTKIPTRLDGEDIVVDGYDYTVQVPFASKKIEGYNLIGAIEDLGKGQRLLSAMALTVDNLPEFPEQARLNELDEMSYSNPDMPREDYRELQQLRVRAQKFFREVLLPLYEAEKVLNATKLETLRSSDLGCIHCNTKRARKSVLVFEREDKTLAMVGRACAKEFFGVDLASALSCANELRDSDNYSNGPRTYSSEGYRREFGLVYWLLKNYGYVSPRVEDSYNTNSRFVPDGTPLHTMRSTKAMCCAIETRINYLAGISPEDFLAASNPIEAERNSFLFELSLAADRSEKARARFISLRELISLGGWDFQTPVTETQYAVCFLRFLLTNSDEVSQALADCTSFWMNLESTEEFMLNCKAIAVAMANKSVGMTSMVILKWMEATREVHKGDFFKPEHTRMFPAAPEPRYLAPMGSGMMDFDVTVMAKRQGGYDEDRWFMLIGRTPENLEVSFFCKQGMFTSAKEGETLQLRGKVKDHKTFNGKFSTSMFFVKER